MADITAMTVAELSAELQKKTLSAEEATSAYLARATAPVQDVGAWLALAQKEATMAARAIDERRARGEGLHPLAGVPAGIKDNICMEGLACTCASKMLENFVPPYTATVVERLQTAGVVCLGKLNMDEFAMGSSGGNSAFKPIKNPLDPTRVPGGSSGGSAAAVAARQAAFALGSDTGGSVRQPAAFCGMVGVKPTYGAVSRHGLVAFASSLDQIGPVARTVQDAALVLSTMAGHDTKDSTSLKTPPPDYTARLDEGVKGLRIALPKQLFGPGIAADVKERVLAAAKTLQGLGASVDEVAMPALEYALPAYYVLSSAEASSNLARFDGVRYGRRAGGAGGIEGLYKASRTEGFGLEVQRRILLGTFVLGAGRYDAYYKKARQVRARIVAECARTFEGYDLLLGPTAPTVAPRLGQKPDGAEHLGEGCTVAANLAGLPAISLPCGRGEGGMPVGLQLVAKALGEPTLFRAAAAYEAERGPLDA